MNGSEALLELAKNVTHCRYGCAHEEHHPDNEQV
jgi:hypothetical protein